VRIKLCFKHIASPNDPDFDEKVQAAIRQKLEASRSSGQPVYKIGKRVAEFVDRFLPPHIVKFFKEYYKKRSKYLHEGIILEDQSFFHFGKNIPQLNKNHDSGCEIPTQVSVINLWEFTSYCLRSLLRAGLC